MVTLDSPPTTGRRPDPARVQQLVALVRSTSGQTRTTVSPLDGEPLAQVPQSSVDDVDAAFAAAREAQVTWSRSSLRRRAKALLRLHDLVLEHQEELLDLVQLESGKTRAHAFDEVAHVALTARFYARRLRSQLRPRRRNGLFPGLTSVAVHQVPKGVVGIVSPWNYPLTMAISDGLPAIAAGNAVVHKPDSQSPLVALAGVELLRRAGFPADVWQVVSGPGGVVGEAVVDRADHVCFTGSTATGRGVAERTARRLVNASLELGGKNPMIVLADADVDKAAAGAVDGCFSSAGQLCVSIERLYVADEVYERFRDAFVERVKAMSLGVSLDWDADMGTLVSPAQLATVSKHVDDAVGQGATLLAGGHARPDIAPWFHEPTVLEDVPESAECFAEETFGPLVSLHRFRGVDEAVRLANSGPYGLNASIFSGHPRRAARLATRIKAGTVNVNEGFSATFGSIDAPMGGMRASGLGRRQGAEGILRYTEPQSVARQGVVPVAGPAFLAPERYARLMTTALRILRRTPRA